MINNVVDLAAYREKTASRKTPIVDNNREVLRNRWGVIRQKLEEKKDAKANTVDEE